MDDVVHHDLESKISPYGAPKVAFMVAFKVYYSKICFEMLLFF